MNLVEGRLSEGRFEAEGFGLATRGWPASTGARNGQRVVFGVRPEDLQPTPAPADSATSIAARVELVELLGGEALVHVRAGNTELTARIPSPVPTTGTEIRLTVPPDKVHLFTRIPAPGSSATRQASHAPPLSRAAVPHVR